MRFKDWGPPNPRDRSDGWLRAPLPRTDWTRRSVAEKLAISGACLFVFLYALIFLFWLFSDRVHFPDFCASQISFWPFSDSWNAFLKSRPGSRLLFCNFFIPVRLLIIPIFTILVLAVIFELIKKLYINFNKETFNKITFQLFIVIIFMYIIVFPYSYDDRLAIRMISIYLVCSFLTGIFTIMSIPAFLSDNFG